MCKRIVFVWSLLFPLLSCAADWEVVANTSLGQIRFDRERVVKADSLIKAVLIYEFKESQKIAQPPYKMFNRREDDVLVDCLHPSLGVAVRRFFDDGQQVGSFVLDAAHVKFNVPVPDTMAETVVVAVCAAALSRK